MAEMNQWKLATIGLLVIGATAGITAFVMGGKLSPTTTTDAVPMREAPASHEAAVPHATPKAEHKGASVQHAQLPEAVVLGCNKEAEEKVASKTEEVVKDAAIGAVIAAGVGAASGAIADGGKGAGKGAAIGSVVGAAGGSLYGLNENKTQDERFRNAYASCLQAKGYHSAAL
jgi:hypothetical protein